MSSLANAVCTALSTLPESTQLSAVRRATSLFSQGQAAEALYFVEDGLVKMTRTNDTGDRIILSICGPGELVGDEILSSAQISYQTDAEVLTTANLTRVPREAVLGLVRGHPEFALAMIDSLLQRRLAMAHKVELLCLHDVEYRILFYLAELSSLVGPGINGDGHHLPITQAELADLIGATRETTSTTLNQLERRGLVKLSRRLLTIPSPATLRSAAAAPASDGSLAVPAVLAAHQPS